MGQNLILMSVSVAQEPNAPVTASISTRLRAFLLDGTISYFSMFPGYAFRSVRLAIGGWLVANLVATLYFLTKGTTLGKSMVGIRQVVMREQLSGKRVFARVGMLLTLFNVFAVRPLISSLTAGISLIWPVFDANGQFLGDKLLGIYTVTNESLVRHEAQRGLGDISTAKSAKSRL